VCFPVEGDILHCDLLNSILKYEVSTMFQKQYAIVLIPLTSSRKCISVFLLECSDFWGSKISGGRGESNLNFDVTRGKSKICRQPLT